MGTALITSVAALGGVIVGGLLNTYLTGRVDKKRGERAARVAARLVRHDLVVVGARLNAVVNGEIYGPEVTQGGWFSIQNWIESRALLAAALDDEAWQQVCNAFLALDRLQTMLQLVAPTDSPARPTDPLRDEHRAAYTEGNSAAEAGYRVLGEFLTRSSAA